MKIGPLEILVIFLAALSAGLVVRLFRGKSTVARQEAEDQKATGVEQSTDSGTGQLKKFGLTLTIFGLIILIFGIGFFEAAAKAYLWAFVFLGVGLVLLMLSRNR